MLTPAIMPESAAAFILFGLLCALRSTQHRPGYLFSMYLLFAGFERLLIEKIRIDPQHLLLGSQLTQAELISIALIVAGLVGALMTMRAGRQWTRILFSAGVLADCANRICEFYCMETHMSVVRKMLMNAMNSYRRCTASNRIL